MRRLGRATAVLAVTVLAAACGIPDVFGEPSGGPASPSSGEPDRVRPRIPVALTYRTDPWPVEYRVGSASGTVEFDRRPVRFALTFDVRTPGQGPSLHKQVVDVWKKHHTQPVVPFSSSTVDGYLAEGRADGPYGEGTYRTYFATTPSKRAGAVLRVYAPPGHAITPAHRAMADRLMKSVRFDTTGLEGAPRGPYVPPAVPLSYVRPAGLTGGETISADETLSVLLEYHEGDVIVNLRGTPSEAKARGTYGRDRRAAAQRFPVRDAGTPGWDDGFHGKRRRGVVEEQLYELRSGRWLVRLESRGAFYKPSTEHLMPTLVRTARLTPRPR